MYTVTPFASRILGANDYRPAQSPTSLDGIRSFSLAPKSISPYPFGLNQKSITPNQKSKTLSISRSLSVNGGQSTSGWGLIDLGAKRLKRKCYVKAIKPRWPFCDPRNTSKENATIFRFTSLSLYQVLEWNNTEKSRLTRKM